MADSSSVATSSGLLVSDKKQPTKERSYPHEVGQWTTHIYVDAESEDLREEVDNILKETQALTFETVDKLHVSLFQGHFKLRIHQVQAFINDLTLRVGKIPKFNLILNRIDILRNDNESRSFICIKIDPRFNNPFLDRLINEIENCLHDFERDNLKEKYQDPFITHCSIIWFQGDILDKEDEALKTLVDTLEQEFQEDPLRLEVSNICVKAATTPIMISSGTSTKELETPISVLQDFCSRRLGGRVPDYRMICQDAPVHKPTFIFRVEIAGVVATASALSKKKAKHAAALKALEELSVQYDDEVATRYIQSQKNIPVASAVVSGQEVGQGDSLEEILNEINPVGKLQEMCMKKRWRPPMYNTIDEVGLPHERLFTMTCEVDCSGAKVTSKGAGRSKKLAKRSAAVEMIALLEAEDATSDIAKLSLAPSQVKTIRENNININIDPTNTVTLFAGKKVVDFFKGLGDELNRELDMIFNSGNTNVAIIEMVAEFLECSVDFHTIPRRGQGKHVFLVSLNPTDQFQCPIPIVTGWGTGLSDPEAKEAAARKAVHLLKEIRYIQ